MSRKKPEDVDPKRCIAVGEGVDQAAVGKPCKFVVQGVYGLVNLVSVDFEGPAHPSYTKEPDEQGNVVVTYTPSVPGQYTLTVKAKDQPIKNNPYKCDVIGELDPKLKRVELITVQGKGVIIAKATKENVFYVDTRRAQLNAGLSSKKTHSPLIQ
jgi:hypothetical protein